MPGPTVRSSLKTFSTRPGIRAAWFFLCALVLATFAGSPNYQHGAEPLAGPYGGDFLQEWLGGWVVLHGDPARFYDVTYARELQHDPALVGFAFDESRYLPLVYPPFYYVLVSPMALVSYDVAVWIWAGLMTAVFMAAVGLLVKGCDDKSSPWVIAACAMFAPALENLNSGQKGAVCLLILVATYRLLRAERSFSAGLVFGLLAFKPQLAVVIGLGLMLRGNGRFACGAAVTVATLVAVCLALGTDVCGQYMTFARGAAEYLQTAGYDLSKSHAWFGACTLLFGPGLPAKLATAGACCLSLGIALLGRSTEWRPSGEDFPRRFAGLMLAGLLCSPHLYTYDLTILLLPIALAVSDRRLIVFAVAAFVAAGIAPAIAATTSIAVMPWILMAWLIALTRPAAPCGVAVASTPSATSH